MTRRFSLKRTNKKHVCVYIFELCRGGEGGEGGPGHTLRTPPWHGPQIMALCSNIANQHAQTNRVMRWRLALTQLMICKVFWKIGGPLHSIKINVMISPSTAKWCEQWKSVDLVEAAMCTLWWHWCLTYIILPSQRESSAKSWVLIWDCTHCNNSQTQRVCGIGKASANQSMVVVDSSSMPTESIPMPVHHSAQQRICWPASFWPASFWPASFWPASFCPSVLLQRWPLPHHALHDSLRNCSLDPWLEKKTRVSLKD